MKYYVCAVRDRAADVYGQPMFFASIGVATRSFADGVNSGDKNSALCQHPEDFDLFLIAMYDDSDGSFVSEKPRQIAIGKDCVRSAQA